MIVWLPAALKTKVLGVESDPPSFHTLWRLTVPAPFVVMVTLRLKLATQLPVIVKVTAVTANTIAVFVGVGGIRVFVAVAGA